MSSFRSIRPARRLLPTVTLALLAACAGGTDAADEVDSLALADSATAAPTAAPAPDVAAEPTLADLEAYDRALAAEVEVLRSVLEQRAAARSGADTIAALLAATEGETAPIAAERAGIDVDRYRRLDDAFGSALAARAMNPGMRAMYADTSAIADLPADAQEAARANVREMMAAFSDSATYRSVPPALHEELTRRAEASLDSLFKERLTLRMRAAGQGG